MLKELDTQFERDVELPIGPSGWEKLFVFFRENRVLAGLLTSTGLLQGCAGNGMPAAGLDPAPPDNSEHVIQVDLLESKKVEINELFLAGEYSKALVRVNSLLEDNPDDTLLLQMKGIFAIFDGETEQAIDAYLKLADLDPSYENLSALAFAYFKAGDLSMSLEVYQQVINLDPENPSGYFEYARALEAAGSLEESLQALHKVLEKLPSDETARYLALQLCLELGHTDEAHTHFSLLEESGFLDHAPESGSNSLKLGLMLEASGQHQKAIELYNDLMEEDPKNVNYLKAAIRALEAAGARRAIVPLCHNWIGLDSNNPRPHFKIADVLIDDRQYRMALSFISDGLELNPEAADGHYLKGLALEGLGRYEEAEGSFGETLKFARGDLYSLAQEQVGRMKIHIRRELLQSATK